MNEPIDEAPFLLLLDPPWWNLLGRYRRWRLLRSLRNHKWTFYVPSEKANETSERS